MAEDVVIKDLTPPSAEVTAEAGLIPIDGSVSTDKVADKAITTPKIADGAVTTPKVRDGAITDAKLDPSGVIARLAQLQQYVDTMDVTIDPDDLGLYQDPDTDMVYPTYRDVQSSNGVVIHGGGGGGGGGGTASAVLTVTNTSGWVSKAISVGAPCVVSLTWSSLEEEMPTGDGTLTVKVADTQVLVRNIQQGTVTQDVGPYLNKGSNKVKFTVTDVYGQSNTKVVTVSVVELTIGSNFDTSGTFAANAPIQFTYTPVGAVQKTVHFEVDGEPAGTDVVTASGYQQTHELAGMSHGAHTLRVWFEATVDGQSVTSNELFFSLTVVSPASNTPIISTPFRGTTATQYETIQIPYTVYTPSSISSVVNLKANGTTVASLTVDRTEHVWAYRADEPGELTLTVQSGMASKSFDIAVAASDIDVDPVTDSLVLNLSAYGRSNHEEHPEVWEDEDNDVSCTLAGFNFVSDGWQTDATGATALRVSGAARVTVPYQMFATDWRGTGKTVEVELATHAVRDYGASILTCFSDSRGLVVTPQGATVTSEQTTITTQFKEDEHVRVSFVCEKRTENRLLKVYVNGILSGVIQYPDDDDFSQSTPVGITIGDDDVTTDVYHIRVYDNGLTDRQVLTNWIADSPDIETMLARYEHNDVCDEYGQVVIEKLPTDLPYMVIECEELPQYKGDKKTVTGYFVDPQDRSRNFTFTGCQANVQGTSSAVYARKNYDLQFKGGFEMEVGGHASNFRLAPGIKPFNRFVIKADVASSEGANNVELVKLFCEADPYKRPEELDDAEVRKGIYGFPIVLFWRDTVHNVTSFLGKGNFNLPKRAPGPYGYTGDMESWEFQNNTSDLMLFKTDYFDETLVTDPTTGEAKAAWLYDYEARFPEDTWDDYSKLQELESFVVACDPAKASDATDRAARIQRFRSEFGNYAEVDSFIFYYIFTELFLMVDSRAKNLFIGFSGGEATGLTAIDRKAVAEPYDMDTSLGIEAA